MPINIADKQTIRREMLAHRNNLSSEIITSAENFSIPVILDIIENLFVQKGHSLTIMSYMSYKNEFPTHKLNKILLESPHRLILPYTASNFEIQSLCIEDFDDMNISKMGIYEPDPDKCLAVSIENIDLILMPGVAFDIHGMRIGFGKGCYDKFLADNKNTELIALAYKFQIIDEVPHEATDIPCQSIITEQEILQCH